MGQDGVIGEEGTTNLGDIRDHAVPIPIYKHPKVIVQYNYILQIIDAPEAKDQAKDEAHKLEIARLTSANDQLTKAVRYKDEKNCLLKDVIATISEELLAKEKELGRLEDMVNAINLGASVQKTQLKGNPKEMVEEQELRISANDT